MTRPAPATKKRKAICADLFCGAGGTSEALREVCAENDLELDLVAVNHWPIAIDTHSLNHSYAKHHCAKLENVDPHQLVPSGRLKLLIAGIECTHHSNARGGKPRSDQSRSSAWLILKWASELYIETIIIENVKEFRSWGPLGANGIPLKSKRGETFLSFLHALKSLGYTVEHRVLCAANYGDPTTRERLIIVARRGGKKIVWPERTHAPAAALKKKQGDLFGREFQPWRTAREIIDWQIKGKSIFGRKKDLAPKTIDRIAAGLRKFGGDYAEPFLVMLYGTSTVRSVDDPVPTVTAHSNHIGLARPVLVDANGQDHAFVIGQQSGAKPRSVNEPVPTVCAAGAVALVEPYLLNIDHQSSSAKSNVLSVDNPVPTVTTKGRTALVLPYLAPVVLPGETGNGARTTPEPYLIEVNHGDNGRTRKARSLNHPLTTVTTKRSKALIQPFVVKYNRTGKAQSVDQPLDTVTTLDRFALVTTEAGTFKLDILFRMLTNRELARAQGLQDSYVFTGKQKDVTRQIGNMVPVQLAKAVIAAQLNESGPERVVSQAQRART